MTACRSCGAGLLVQERISGLCRACAPGAALRIAWLPANEAWCLQLAGGDHGEIVPLEGHYVWTDKAELLSALRRQGFEVKGTIVRRADAVSRPNA